MDDKMEYMDNEFKKYGFTFEEYQLRNFYTFYEMLIEKNKVVNLTSITDFSEVVQKHFIDSILLHQVMELNHTVRILDLGTGAGFPGIPLKIAFPDIDIVLMDSLNKRIVFLNEVIEKLDLDHVEAVHARAEEFAREKNQRETYDFCVSRAVANLATLEEYCLPFVKIGGAFISYKSGEIDEEVNKSKHACFLLGGKLRNIHRFSLEEGNMQRSFVIVDKIKKSPGTYPRKAGTPAKNPLS